MIRDKIKEIADNIDKFERRNNRFIYGKAKISVETLPSSGLILSSYKTNVDLRIEGNLIKLEDDELDLIRNTINNIFYEDIKIKNKEQNDLLNSINFNKKEENEN